jgi:tRNA A37 methylthiotransferase MiaB
MQKKKVVLFGSVPMSLSELQMAPAIIAAHVKKRGHAFVYHDINLKLFEYCNNNHNLYSDYSELLQDHTQIDFLDDIINRWQQFIINQLVDIDVILINVFSVFSQTPALRIMRLCRTHRPNAKIIIGGIGSHKKVLSGINEFNRLWIEQTFPAAESDIFGQLCLNNDYVDDWQPTVDLDVLNKWLPQQPVLSYNKQFDFDHYRVDQYHWLNGEKRMPMLGSHGCVRQCSFCDVIKHFPRYSFVEADILTKSIIDAYQQTGIAKVQFMDSLVNGSMSNFLNLLKNLSQAKQNKWLPDNFSWSGTYICRPRSKLLDEIHRYLPESGADNLVIGVETGSDRIRYQMEKKFLNEDLLAELDAFENHGVKASALFFPSWPTETSEDFDQTLKLFSKLARYGQKNVLHSAMLGTSGFSLIDGTPIDRDKHLYGLEQGPVPWLWKCQSNPALTFWETVRRRLLMAEWCELYGIRLEQENTFRRYLAFNLGQYRDLILSYSGHLPGAVDIQQYLPEKTQHSLQFNMINNHSEPVIVTVRIASQCQRYVCAPGQHCFVFEFERQLRFKETLTVSAEFSNNHRTQWNTYDSGDYYDQQGIYINQVVLDHNDITLWGWNHSVVTQWQCKKQLPNDYHKHENRRCLTSAMTVCMTMPAYHSPQKHISNCREPEITQERKFVDSQLYDRLTTFNIK